MTFPMMKRINTELFIGRWVELDIQKWGPNFLGKLKRVKCWRHGMENHNGSLFEITLTCKVLLKFPKVNCE